MAGKGSEVGSKFEELKQIIDGIELKEKRCNDAQAISRFWKE